MLHLVFCFGVWIVVFSYLAWRSQLIIRTAFKHLQRLHQIPCSKCAYFTGDYRLKCTVNPTVAMSEEAIACRDFVYSDAVRGYCQNCTKDNQCDRTKEFSQKSEYLLSKSKLILK